MSLGVSDYGIDPINYARDEIAMLRDTSQNGASRQIALHAGYRV